MPTVRTAASQQHEGLAVLQHTQKMSLCVRGKRVREAPYGSLQKSAAENICTMNPQPAVAYIPLIPTCISTLHYLQKNTETAHAIGCR